MFLVTVVDGDGKKYIGIRSTLGIVDLITEALIDIGGYSKSEAEYVLEEIEEDELTDGWLREFGITLPKNYYYTEGNHFFLRKVEDGLWEFQDNA